MAYGFGLGFVGIMALALLSLLHIAHTQRGPVGLTEFFNDFRQNHDDQRLYYSHQYQISDVASQVHILHREQRQGEHVTGSYSHQEPSGHIRSVHYEVRGPRRGFRAVIEQRTGNSRVHQTLGGRDGRQPTRALALAEPVAFVI
ncbi:cuticle protein 7 [Drosophila bipectinata]|uniref:cuticle protein 7 n=1 Tax=Drosophila bipectinata TaxID=42026 RepID=UPI001C8AE93E|nr:cuticle protein 7 [Drosophila bipectinata]